MKQKTTLFLSALFLGFLLTACGDETKEASFADLTIQQNKEKIQNDGVATMQKMNGMTELSAVYAAQDLTSLVQASELTGDSIDEAVFKLLLPIAGLDKNVFELTKLRSIDEGVLSISKVFEKIAGVYTYNPTDNSFVRVAKTSEITFLFPIGTSMTNNGKLTINNFSVVQSTQTEIAEELPQTLDVKLYKDNISKLNNRC